VLDGSSTIRAFLEKTWAAYPELHHWFTNLSLTVRGDSTMHGECRITALCVKPSGTASCRVLDRDKAGHFSEPAHRLFMYCGKGSGRRERR
jgi:hypothetical protein